MILLHVRSIYPTDTGWKLIPAWAATWTILVMLTRRGRGRLRPMFTISHCASGYFTAFVPFVLSLSTIIRCLVGMECWRIPTCSVPAVSLVSVAKAQIVRWNRDFRLFLLQGLLAR